MAPYNGLAFSTPLLSMYNISPKDEIILKEQTENFDMRIGHFKSIFCLFFSMGRAVKSGQLLPEISVIVTMCMNLLKCPINTKLLHYVLTHIIEYNPI